MSNRGDEPVFPPNNRVVMPSDAGMTIREELASRAPFTVLVNEDETYYRARARDALRWANALIAEMEIRNKPRPVRRPPEPSPAPENEMVPNC